MTLVSLPVQSVSACWDHGKPDRRPRSKPQKATEQPANLPLWWVDLLDKPPNDEQLLWLTQLSSSVRCLGLLLQLRVVMYIAVQHVALHRPLRWMLFLWALPLDAILQMLLQRTKGITQRRLGLRCRSV